MKEAGDSVEGWVWRKQINCCCSIWVTGPETAAMFGRTTSNCCWPLLWRFPILLWSIGTIGWSLMDFWGPLYMWPLYMTHWGLLLIFLQSFLGCIVAVNGARGRLIDDSKYELPGYVKTYWSLYNMAIPIAFLITFFYWALLRGFYYGPVMPISNPESVKDTAKLIMLDDEMAEETAITTTVKDELIIEITTPNVEIDEAPLNSEVEVPTPVEDKPTEPTLESTTLKVEIDEAPLHSEADVPTQIAIDDPTTDNVPNNNIATDIDTTNANVIDNSPTTTDYNSNTNDVISTNYIPNTNDIMTEYTTDDNLPISTTIAASTATKKPLMYSPDPTLDLFIHGVNSAIMLVELLTAGHPSRLLHVWQPLLVACAYMLVGVVYFAADGTDPAGNHWIYPMIDWSKPQQALLVSFLCAVYLCLMHALVVLVASLRDKISKTCCPNSNTVVLYDGCSGWSVQ